MESAVYSPSPAPFFPFFWSFSFCTSMGLLSSGAAAAADWGSFGTILLHSIGNTNRARVAASADRSGQIGLSSRITLIYLKFQWLKSLTIRFNCSTKEAPLTMLTAYLRPSPAKLFCGNDNFSRLAANPDVMTDDSSARPFLRWRRPG